MFRFARSQAGAGDRGEQHQVAAEAQGRHLGLAGAQPNAIKTRKEVIKKKDLGSQLRGEDFFWCRDTKA